ncbi:MAG: P1 family peptidase [Alphaproteobacteria bacterium]
MPLRLRPGPRNLITDVAGLAVGNAEDRRALTGTTVLLADPPAVAAVDVRGGAPGTSETDALNPTCIAGRTPAIVLSGGSAFGLEAAAGARSWLAAHGRGLAFGGAIVPIVPTAILFDLVNGGDKAWGDRPPYRDLAVRACNAAGADFALGNAGAGLGAMAHRLKGGLGSASYATEEGPTVGALVAVNAWGGTVFPGTDTFYAWHLELDGEMGGQRPPAGPIDAGLDLDGKRPAAAIDAIGTAAPGADGNAPGANTTIGIVATDADLTQAETQRLALMAHDGFARAIRPAHTPFDGDTIFALATGRVPVPAPRALWLARLGSLAADCMARAIARGVFAAEGVGGHRSWRDLRGAIGG